MPHAKQAVLVCARILVSYPDGIDAAAQALKTLGVPNDLINAGMTQVQRNIRKVLNVGLEITGREE